MRDLTDKLVWITGAGTGIGAAGAKALAAAGCRLILSGRRRDPLEAVAAEIGAQATIMPLDVADRAAVETAGREIQAIHGTVDVLVNNAGINVPKRHWPDVSPEDWEQVIQIDVNGVYYCTQAVLPAMRDRGEGLIVNISSWAGARVSFLTGPAYTAAKHAVNAMTENLNMEEGINGIRACAICPGEVSTDIMDKRPIPVPADVRAKMVQPEDMGETILYVARMPAHVCVNQIIISPTWNRGYVALHGTSAPV